MGHLDCLDPNRFLHDPRRMTAAVHDVDGGRRLQFTDTGAVLDFEAEIVLDDAGGRAHAAFLPRSPGLLRALSAFARRHGVAIPSRFERRWSAADDPEIVSASLDDMIRKTVENMHMVHTAAPAMLPPFPLEYLSLPSATAGGIPFERWRSHLTAFFPGGTPVPSRDDRTRLLRCLMTDSTLLEKPGDAPAIMAEVVAALKRIETPRDEWARGADGEPLRPPSAGLVLARLTNIRWMNETAEVHEARRKAGLRSAFGTFVSLLAALPDDETPSHKDTPSFAAASAAAILINWLTAHLNFYPLEGLGHRNDRIDFITTRLLFEEILNPFYAHCVATGHPDLKHLPPPQRRHILRALRDGFLHESRLPGPPRRGWAARLSARFGRAPAETLSIERVAPLALFPQCVDIFLSHLADPHDATLEAMNYGVGRSISDGTEYWSERHLRRNLDTLRDLSGGSNAVEWESLADRAVQVAARISGPPPRWEDLTERDRAYVTPAELDSPAFRILPVDWRMRVHSE